MNQGWVSAGAEQDQQEDLRQNRPGDEGQHHPDQQPPPLLLKREAGTDPGEQPFHPLQDKTASPTDTRRGDWS